MSLHHAAQHLASQGRNGDSMLVHMTPGEVSGLQTLLQSKGRDLTINPKTGLPEAWAGSDLGGALYDSARDFTGSIGSAVQDATSSPIGSMLVGAALVAAGVPPQFAGLATGAASYASGNSFKQSVAAGLSGQGGGSFADSQGWAGSLNPSDAAPPTAPGGAVPAAAPSAPVAAPVETAIPVEAAAPAQTTATAYPTEQTMYPGEMSQAPRVATAEEAFQMGQALPPSTAASATSGGIMDTLSGYYDAAGKWVAANPKTALAGAAGLGALSASKEPEAPKTPEYEGAYIRPYSYDPKTGGLTQITPVKAPVKKAASGGMMSGGAVERMSNANAIGMNTGYPQADITGHAYATPWQTPVSDNVVSGSADTGVNRMTGQMLAGGGLSSLGGYSDGGRLLKGPGDGVSDSIPATIANKQPARLADGEFVVPARIVSELGNGSTDAGARQLYKMMDRIQAARRKTTGKDKVATNSRASKALPA